MHTLIALMVAAAAACAIARPPAPTVAPALSPRESDEPSRRYMGDYLLPRLLMPNYFGYEENIRGTDDHEWLNREIQRLNQMADAEDAPYIFELPRWISQDPFMSRPYQGPVGPREMPSYMPDSPGAEDVQVLPPPRDIILPETIPNEPIPNEPILNDPIPNEPIPNEPIPNDPIPNEPIPNEPIPNEPIPNEPILNKHMVNEPEKVKSPEPVDERPREKKQYFAMTPLDKGYYDPEEKHKTQQSDGPHEGGESKVIEVSPPRQTRQNPNLGRTKNLVAENLDRLRTGLANKDYRIPVSLLPTNLRWLKVNHPTDETSTHEAPEGTDKPRHYHVLETANDPADSIYGIALIAAVGTALAMSIVGFAFGWYTLSKKAKAAADVDYPAYGVTGPTIDSSGDRKLAHSAHMYHYQHQKQQIIAMERNGLEQRNGSVSDPESEEENEEGDYTVYECPGFATTGEMEVKNPMFSEDPTPATPGKCELVKPQPKD